MKLSLEVKQRQICRNWWRFTNNYKYCKKSKWAFKMTFWFDYSSLFRGNLILNLWRKFREKNLNGKYFYRKLKNIFKK